MHKIIFKDGVPDRSGVVQPEAKGVHVEREGILHKVYAKKEVILSSGTVASPQLLMLSGIGPKRTLKQVKVRTAPVVNNLLFPETYMLVCYRLRYLAY